MNRGVEAGVSLGNKRNALTSTYGLLNLIRDLSVYTESFTAIGVHRDGKVADMVRSNPDDGEKLTGTRDRGTSPFSTRAIDNVGSTENSDSLEGHEFGVTRSERYAVDLCHSLPAEEVLELVSIQPRETMTVVYRFANNDHSSECKVIGVHDVGEIF